MTLPAPSFAPEHGSSGRPNSGVALVAGAAGFLGSHLTERLLDLGFFVIGIDNLCTGSDSNLAHLMEDNRFEFVHHDVTSPIDAEAELIFNLACPASPRWYQQDPVRTLTTSVQGALNLLTLAQRTGAVIVQASTSEVYGSPQVSPQSETYWGNVNPIGPRSCYDEGKRAAETLFADFRKHHGVDARIARIFNTYGPRMAEDDGRVVSNFIVQALVGNALTVYGDGAQTRSFCYVDDLVEGLLRLGLRPNSTESPVNLGNPRELTIAQIARMVLDLTGSQSEVVNQPLPVDDPLRRCPDISLARTLLAWEPTVTLEAGLGRTIEFFRSSLNA